MPEQVFGEYLAFVHEFLDVVGAQRADLLAVLDAVEDFVLAERRARRLGFGGRCGGFGGGRGGAFAGVGGGGYGLGRWLWARRASAAGDAQVVQGEAERFELGA